MSMDKDTQATLHHSRIGRVDKMTAGGRLEDMVRRFRSLAQSKRSEYYIMIGETSYGPEKLENLATQLGIED
jgi:hypothetical protein